MRSGKLQYPEGLSPETVTFYKLSCLHIKHSDMFLDPQQGIKGGYLKCYKTKSIKKEDLGF